MSQKRIPASLLCSLFIAGVLVALAYLPDLVRQKRFSFSSPTADRPIIGFPLDQEFTIVSEDKAKKTVSLRKLASQSKAGLIVNFWATWCPPCLEELPSLELLNRQLNAAPAEITPKLVTISVDETTSVIFSLYRTLDFAPSFLVLHDKAGDLARSLGTTKFPETYWIDANGKILYKWIGPQNWLGSDVVKTLSHLRQG